MNLGELSGLILGVGESGGLIAGDGQYLSHRVHRPVLDQGLAQIPG